MATIQDINVSTANDGLGDSLRNSQIKANVNFSELNTKKVEVENGKGLSENDFTDVLKDKLDTIENNAEKNIQPDWLQNDNTKADFIKNKPVDFGQYFSALGSFTYEDSVTKTTPLSYVTGTLQLTNDTLGQETKTNLSPYGVTNAWDSTTNKIGLSELTLGDELVLTIKFDCLTTASNQTIDLSLLLAESTTKQVNLPFCNQIICKTIGVNEISETLNLNLTIQEWIDTLAKINFQSSGNCLISNIRFDFTIIRKAINIIDITDDNFRTFEIKNIEPNIDDTTVEDGGICLGFNPTNQKINKILFDFEFSKYLLNFDLVKSVYNFSLTFFDKATKKSFTSFVTGFSTIGARYLLTLEETITNTDFLNGGKIEVFLTASKGNPFTIEALNFASLPTTGEAGKLYITVNNGSIYRWDGTNYRQIGGGADTLDDITDRGNTTTNSVTVRGLKVTNLPNSTGDIAFTEIVKIKADGTMGKELDKPTVSVTIPDTLPNPATPTTQTLTIVHTYTNTPPALNTNVQDLNDFIMTIGSLNFTNLTAADWFRMPLNGNTAIDANVGTNIFLIDDLPPSNSDLVTACAYPNLVLPFNKNWVFTIGATLPTTSVYVQSQGIVGIGESNATTNIGLISGFISSVSTAYRDSSVNFIESQSATNASPRVMPNLLNGLVTFVKVGNILNITVRGGVTLTDNVDVTGINSFKPLIHLVKWYEGGNQAIVTDFGKYYIAP